MLSSRPPTLIIPNEPEARLHPDLLPLLARLIEQAARRAQVVVVSHAAELVFVLEADAACARIILEKDLGESVVRNSTPPEWTGPSRSSTCAFPNAR